MAGIENGRTQGTVRLWTLENILWICLATALITACFVLIFLS